MKIGLIGGPGSGKTELAEALQARLGLTPIDGYVEQLEDRFNYQFGRFATYVGNLAIMIERHALERGAGENYVTCGTPLDTVTYMAANAYLGGDEGWQRRALGSLTTAGCMVDDMWEYDVAFYLPSDPGEEDFSGIVARELPTTLRLFELPYVTLDQSDADARLTAALAALDLRSQDEARSPQ